MPSEPFSEPSTLSAGSSLVEHDPADYLFSSDPVHDIVGVRMQAIWRAVLLQMITDLKSNCRKPESKRAKIEAVAWFASPSFDDVCIMGGYEPDYVRELLRKAKERDYQWRLPSGKGWRSKAKSILPS